MAKLPGTVSLSMDLEMGSSVYCFFGTFTVRTYLGALYMLGCGVRCEAGLGSLGSAGTGQHAM
ncbi:MAG: hypothetical protein BJ554DRAFT_5726 [Olpidium bornovanus]|uniref:Uncharacterized protein n=1 Tax=Olpidium bornovanus TaxID=278681 RepID=A0A8H7ZZA9_9FUNG|nr:MAG: hypothetical protein BJ554DRAFT_5726 [Olpidium bornovanus]